MIKRKNIKVSTSINLKSFKTYILSGICGILAVTTIFMTIESSTSGAEFANLQNKEAQLLSTQQELQQKLVESLSLNSLQEQSLGLGFVRVTNLVYATNVDGVATARLP